MTTDDLAKLEDDLWRSADNLRANSKLTSSDYFMPVLGIIFLRHAANRFDAAYHLMSRHSRQSQARKFSFDCSCVRMTYSAGLDAQPHLPRSWLRNW